MSLIWDQLQDVEETEIMVLGVSLSTVITGKN